MKILIEKIENTENINEKIRLLKILKKITNFHINNYEKVKATNGGGNG
ncbi:MULTISPECIES: hypothetical protein [Terrisporobacter]|nr:MULTISPECIES: hypothetical protein [Terrisporobacter]